MEESPEEQKLNAIGDNLICPICIKLVNNPVSIICCKYAVFTT